MKYQVRVGVFCFIEDASKKILLLERKNTAYFDGFYTIPSGHLEFGESLEGGIVREVYEETGLTIDTNTLIPVCIQQLVRAQSENNDCVNIYFSYKLNSSNPILKHEKKGADIGWFDMADLPVQLVSEVLSVYNKLKGYTGDLILDIHKR